MKKRDKKKQDKIHKVTTKRALYEKQRKLKRKLKARTDDSVPGRVL